MEQPAPMVTTPPSTAKVAFQQGLIFGVIQAVIASIVLIANASMGADMVGVALLLSTVSFLTGLAAYFVAGILAAKQNGKVRTGVFAGMWTGGIYGIIGFVVSMIIFFQITYPRLIDAATASGLYANMDAYKVGAEIGGVGASVLGIIFAVGLGAGLGALGGLIGRNISPFKPMQLAPALVPAYAFYPGQPMSAQPSGYPAQPYADPNPPVYPPQPAQYMNPNPPVYPPQPASAEQIYFEQPAANPYTSNPPQQ